MDRLLAARAALRLGRPESALSVLERAPFDSDRSRAEQSLLEGASHARLGDQSAASLAFAAARAHAISAGDATLDGEIVHQSAFAALNDEECLDDDFIDDVYQFVGDGLDALESSNQLSQGPIPKGHVLARLSELLGLLDVRKGRYRDALTNVRRGLRNLEASRVPDVFLEAFAVKNLTLLARDFDLADAESISARAIAFPWTADLSAVEFAASEAASWCSALRGDTVEALSRLRHAARVAGSIPQQVYVSVGRALIARESGYSAVALEELRHAFDLAGGYDWSRSDGDLRLVLLDLSQLAAPIAPIDARRAFATYQAIAPRIDFRYAGRGEARIPAEEAFTEGLVLRAEGHEAAAADRFASAFKRWSEIGYDWRAARAATELAEMDAGNVFRIAVRRELVARPDSIFANRARLVA